MAEHFYGQRTSIHFSNGGAKLLLQAWIYAGEQPEASPVMHEVVAFLRHRREHGAAGGRAFPLDPPPPEIASPAHLQALGTLIVTFAQDLARGRLDSRLDAPEDRDWELLWLAKMLDLADLVQDASRAWAEGYDDVLRTLSARDHARCMYYRAGNRLGELLRTCRPGDSPPDPHEKLALVDTRLALLATLASSINHEEWIYQTTHHLELRSDLLLSLGDSLAAAQALREAAAIQTDREYQQALMAYAAFLSEAPHER